MIQKPENLYHGSAQSISGALRPVLHHDTLDHVHTRSAVFATERKDVAALFMFPMDILASIGFEQDLAYICIWGKHSECSAHSTPGFLYTLPTETFEKVGKDYEWQSFEEVVPTYVHKFDSVIDGMLVCGVRIYFIDDEVLFDRVVAEKNNRLSFLRDKDMYR